MTQSFVKATATYPADRFASIRHGDRHLPHGERMVARRGRQLARTPGFTPVRNARIEGMALRALQVAQALGYTGARLEAEAMAMLRRQLPAQGFAKRHRAPRPSKSDSPHYRRGGGVPEGHGG